MGSANRRVRFGTFQLDIDTAELWREGRKVPLPDQAFRVLQVLLERPGTVVTRDELRLRLWAADTFVDFDAGLNNAINKLRQALDDSPDRPRFIETVPRRGYRLIAPIEPEATSQSRWWKAFAAAAAVVAVLGSLSIVVHRTWSARDAEPSNQVLAIQSLAVMPFENLSGDPAKQYIVDGITDAVSNNLAQIRTLRVLPRTSSIQYKRAGRPLSSIVREQDLDAALDGTVSLAGHRIVVRVQLIQADEDRVLWSESFERDLPDLLALQSQIAMVIARRVHLQIRPDERDRLARWPTVNPDAYDAYLRGRFELNRRIAAATLKAIEHFEEAITKDGRYASAYAGLSDAYRHLDLQGLAPPSEAMPKAEAAARQALAIDDSLAEAHASLAGVLYRYHWDWTAAEREFQRSLEFGPNVAETRRAYSIYLGVMRRFDESLEQARRARQLNPLSAEIHMDLVQALFWAERSHEAFAELDRARGLFAAAPRVDLELGYEHVRRRRWADAIAALEKANNPRRPLPWLGFAYGKCGRLIDARTILAALHETSRREYLTPQAFAIVHIGLGERDEAFRWLERAFEQRAVELRGFSKGLFEFVSDDPRFQDLLRRMKLADFKEFRRDVVTRSSQSISMMPQDFSGSAAAPVSAIAGSAAGRCAST